MGSTVFAQLPAEAPIKPGPQQGPPPKNLTVRPDGHVSANQDPANPDNFEVHVVKQGETLSGIAGEVLKNSRLWPQLWEQNEHIINPHWIYPNDKILVRPITAITEAKPPEPAPEPPAPVAAAPEPAAAARATRPPAAPAPEAAKPNAPDDTFFLVPEKPVSEVKFTDLYCSGFVRTSSVPKDLKVIAKFDATGAVHAGEGDYVYLSQGSEDGIVAGSVYQTIRPTKALTNPNGRTKADRELGMHYLEVGQLRIVLVQPDFSMGRVLHNCGDAVEVGDILMPFQQLTLPARDRSRPFNPMMTATSGVKGIIISAHDSLLNFGSSVRLSGKIPGAGGRLSSIERGIAGEGSIVYIDLGQEKAVKAGDVFLVYRNVEVDKRLYDVPKEAQKLKGTRTAVGEMIVLKVGERASTALVTYASDVLVQGDAVERR